MASHGVRKLGLLTGLVMLIFLFIGTIPAASIDLYIVDLPAGVFSVRLYTWGIVEAGVPVHMFSLPWPSCLFSWLTTAFFMISIAMTISASTPGSLRGNSKRMFGISAVFCGMHAMLYAFLVVFSSLSSSFFLVVGPGFWAMIIFSMCNLVSLVKVQ